jgi:hypothetical protein
VDNETLSPPLLSIQNNISRKLEQPEQQNKNQRMVKFKADINSEIIGGLQIE